MAFGQLTHRESLSDMALYLKLQKISLLYAGVNQFDLKTAIPEYVFITEGAVHDVNILDHVDLPSGSCLAIDPEPSFF